MDRPCPPPGTTVQPIVPASRPRHSLRVAASPSPSSRLVRHAGQPSTAPPTPNTRMKSRVTNSPQLRQVGIYWYVTITRHNRGGHRGPWTGRRERRRSPDRHGESRRPVARRLRHDTPVHPTRRSLHTAVPSRQRSDLSGQRGRRAGRALLLCCGAGRLSESGVQTDGVQLRSHSDGSIVADGSRVPLARAVGGHGPNGSACALAFRIRLHPTDPSHQSSSPPRRIPSRLAAWQDAASNEPHAAWLVSVEYCTGAQSGAGLSRFARLARGGSLRYGRVAAGAPDRTGAARGSRPRSGRERTHASRVTRSRTGRSACPRWDR